MNQAFKKQCDEIKKERNERSEINSQLQRESQANPKNVPTTPAPAYVASSKRDAKSVAPRAPTDSGYLEPQPQIQSSRPTYLEPKSGTNQSSSYLEPTNPFPTRANDTYTGPVSGKQNVSQEKDTYMPPSNSSDYLNDDINESGYVNDDVVNELDSNRFGSNRNYPDGYFKRVGSNSSASTVTSTASSTAPLLGQKYEPKFTKIKTNPNVSADNFKSFNKQNNALSKNEINFSKLESDNVNRFVYTPPQPVHLNKLTQFKPNKTNETDV